VRQNFAVVLAGGGPRGATRPAPTLAPTEAEAATFDEGDLNRFGYLEGDADGARCPIGSHVLRGRGDAARRG